MNLRYWRLRFDVGILLFNVGTPPDVMVKAKYVISLGHFFHEFLDLRIILGNDVFKIAKINGVQDIFGYVVSM